MTRFALTHIDIHMYRLIRYVFLLAIIGIAAGLWITRAKTLPQDALAGITPDLERGEWVFYASGCASCHAAKGAKDADKLILTGGREFPSPFGTFYAPNISPSAAGIGDWTALDLANAMIHGTSPEGQHYYPAFPFTSYAKAELSDIVSLHGFIQTLPASDVANKAHDVGFPFNIRRSLGGWKFLFLRDDWAVADAGLSDQEKHGRYLTEALGHCGECHSPRNPLGGIEMAKWLGGAANPSGPGKIPNITPKALFWSAADVAEYLNSGFTPEFDSAGGHMADVIENTSKLGADDRAAIAAYLQKVPPVE